MLGEVVADAAGPTVFDAVERVRRLMVEVREAKETGVRDNALAEAADILASLSLEQKIEVARAYTLYLQLVNVCENAYRTHRLRGRPRRQSDAPGARLTFVLTAHPTESRSPVNIRLLLGKFLIAADRRPRAVLNLPRSSTSLYRV